MRLYFLYHTYMSEAEINTNLNKEQKQAVEHDNGPLLIVAGAGTGKTTVVTERIHWLIENKKLKTDEILALTFTDKAAGEMEERVDKLLPYGYVDLWISTFHSFCERILKAHALDIGLPSDFKLINETESWLLVKKNLDKFTLDYYKPLGNPTKFIHALLKHFSRCKDEEIYADDYLKYAEELNLNLDNPDKAKHIGDDINVEELTQEAKRIQEIADAYHIYQQVLLEHNALDFGDVISYTLKLFKTRPKILKLYQKQFKYILVDEFQDTNWAQYELVKLLAGQDKNITVVGDDDQSIYKFRGASVSNILNFKKDFPEAREIFLQTNYRNPQVILDASYDFIQLNNPDRLEVKLQEQGNKLNKKLTAIDKQRAGIYDWQFLSDLESEVDFVINKIIELNSVNAEFTWNDFAILVRSNDAAGDFIQELEKREVPYQFLAARGLYLKPVIRDIVNYLRLLDDYRESPALYRILSMPVLDIPQYQIANLMYWAGRKNWSLFEIIKNISTLANIQPKTVTEINKLTSWLDKHTLLAREKSVWPVVISFLQDSGYIKYVESLSPLESKQQFSYLNQFAQKIKEFEKASDENKISDFLTEFEMELEAGDMGTLSWDPDEGPEMIKIMTIHSAKGLEFPYVFIPNMVDKRFPTITRRDPIDIPEALIKDILPTGDSHVQEERRLLYVAMTRAKTGLFLTGAADYGGTRGKKPSQFITELNFLGESSGHASVQENKILSSKKIKQAKNSVKAEIIKTHNHTSTPDKFSFTQLEAFSKCPLQYKYAHILRIPVRGKHTFSFGKSMHATLQKFFELVRNQATNQQGDLFATHQATGEITASLKDLLNFYEESWIDDWYDNKKHHDDYKAQGKKALEDFYAEWSQRKPVPEFLEKGFNVKIGDYTIRGVIDRVDRLANNKIEIIDYKTGTSKDLEDLGTAKNQLLIYQLAAEQVLKEDVDQLTFYYLNDGKKVSFLGTDKQMDKLQTDVVDIIEKIIAEDFQPTPVPQICKYCDFRDICDHAQL